MEPGVIDVSICRSPAGEKESVLMCFVELSGKVWDALRLDREIEWHVYGCSVRTVSFRTVLDSCSGV